MMKGRTSLTIVGMLAALMLFVTGCYTQLAPPVQDEDRVVVVDEEQMPEETEVVYEDDITPGIRFIGMSFGMIRFTIHFGVPLCTGITVPGMPGFISALVMAIRAWIHLSGAGHPGHGITPGIIIAASISVRHGAAIGAVPGITEAIISRPRLSKK